MVVVFVGYEDGVDVGEVFGFDVDWVDEEGFGGGFKEDACVIVQPNEEDAVFLGDFIYDHVSDSCSTSIG